jgi:hypothetical protein
MGGYTPPTVQALTEQYDGTSWTEVSDLNTARYDLSGSGSSTDALAYAGNSDPPRQALTEFWNGSSWTEIADLSTARSSGNNAGAGTGSSSAVLATGQTPGSVTTTTTEEFTAPSVFQQENLGQVFYNSTSDAFKVTRQSVPAGTWASGGPTNAAIYSRAGAGTQNAALLSGGNGSSATNEEYNGTAWTELADLNTGREALASSRSGTTTASLVFSGELPSPAYLANNESWDGSSWTEVNDLNTARRSSTGSGTQTAAIIFSGDTGSNTANTEIWNGTSWTEVNNLNTARQRSAGSGLQTAALAIGGDNPTPTNVAITESWDGTSWTEIGDLNTARRLLGAGGRSGNSDALAFGGLEPAISAKTEYYNGSSWSEQNDLSTARRAYNSGSGTSFSAILGGGFTTTGVANTEEWNVPATNSTLTAS